MKVANDFSSIELMNAGKEGYPIVLHDISQKAGLKMNKKHFNCLCVFGETVYIGTRNSKLFIYTFDGSGFTDAKVVIPHCQVVSSITATHKYFISVPESDDETVVSIWEAGSRSFLTALKGHKSQVSKVIFLKEDGFIATSSWDSTVKIWKIDQNLTNDDPFQNFTADGYPILALEEDKEKDVLILGGDDCYLTFWNWRKDEKIGKIFGHAGSVTFIYSFSPYTLTAGGDNKFKVIHCKQTFVEQKQMTQLKEQQPQLKVEYKISVISQIKKQYDSNLFAVQMKNGSLFLMDRQGSMFLYNYKDEESMKMAGNQFSYNENVTGMERYGNFLLVTTTKGAVKVFTYELKDQN